MTCIQLHTNIVCVFIGYNATIDVIDYDIAVSFLLTRTKNRSSQNQFIILANLTPFSIHKVYMWIFEMRYGMNVRETDYCSSHRNWIGELRLGEQRCDVADALYFCSFTLSRSLCVEVELPSNFALILRSFDLFDYFFVFGFCRSHPFSLCSTFFPGLCGFFLSLFRFVWMHTAFDVTVSVILFSYGFSFSLNLAFNLHRLLVPSLFSLCLSSCWTELHCRHFEQWLNDEIELSTLREWITHIFTHSTQIEHVAQWARQSHRSNRLFDEVQSVPPPKLWTVLNKIGAFHHFHTKCSISSENRSSPRIEMMFRKFKLGITLMGALISITHPDIEQSE